MRRSELNFEKLYHREHGVPQSSATEKTGLIQVFEEIQKLFLCGFALCTFVPSVVGVSTALHHNAKFFGNRSVIVQSQLVEACL